MKTAHRNSCSQTTVVAFLGVATSVFGLTVNERIIANQNARVRTAPDRMKPAATKISHLFCGSIKDSNNGSVNLEGQVKS